MSKVQPMTVPTPSPTKPGMSWWKRLAIAGAVLFIAGKLISAYGHSATSTDTVPATYVVTYQITGSASSVDITSETGNGGTSQLAGLALPATEVYRMTAGSFVYISAQNQGDTGSVTCEILVNGLSVQTNTSDGGYTIATCSGRL